MDSGEGNSNRQTELGAIFVVAHYTWKKNDLRNRSTLNFGQWLTPGQGLRKEQDCKTGEKKVWVRGMRKNI